jgi:Kef-type K+ transport system membrane component KefB
MTDHVQPSGMHAKRSRTWLAYGGMIGATLLAVAGIRTVGLQQLAPAPVEPSRYLSAQGTVQLEVLLHVLLALLIIIALSRALGAVFQYLHQPAVIGEVVAGIALGPSFLGALAPEVSAYILPPSVAPTLGLFAQIGVILFMFLVGMELDTNVLAKKPHAAMAISHASIVAPFLLGGALALWLYPRLSTNDVPFDLFAMFMGVAMSTTAFPVLARILTDRGLHDTRLGVIALSCAAVDDVTAWCLLALMVSMAQSRSSGALLVVGATVAYILFMILVVRPLAHRYVRGHEARKQLGRSSIAAVFMALLLSALATEFIGIHAIFGAFLLGAVIPHDSMLARTMRSKLEDVVVVLLLPAFFAFTGMRTQMGLVSGVENWLICAAIITVACAGKLGGTYVAARLSGLDRRDAASLGALMNTRGLMELIVLNIGLDLGVISPTLFAMMVLMAVVTTFATAPLLSLIQGETEVREACVVRLHSDAQG